MSWNVSDVARRTHLTVRTLHHYDRIGLVHPSRRTEAGYRVYAPADLVRLQQVLFFRELGFALTDIRRIMTARSFERRNALAAQRALLVQKADRVRTMIETIDRTLGAISRGETLAPDEEEFEMFADFDPRDYEEEARHRWGHTEVYRESKRRTDRYTPSDWKQLGAQSEALNRELAACMDRGLAPGSPAAMALAERHRQHIDTWFYPCTHEIQVGLAGMYVGDPRFAATYDAVRPGLAHYLRDAIVANAARRSRK